MNDEEMSSIFFVLNKTALLTREDNRAMLRCSNGRSYFISPPTALVLSVFQKPIRFSDASKRVCFLFSMSEAQFEQWFTRFRATLPDVIVRLDSVPGETFSDSSSGNTIDDMESAKWLETRPLYREMLLVNRLQGPQTISFNVTNQCRFHCIYCHNEKNANASVGNESFISLSTVKHFMQQAKERGLETVIITGGDPILYPNLFELIAFLSSMHVKTLLSTKTLLNDNLLRKLKAAGLTELQFSLDTLSPELLDQMIGLTDYHVGVYETLHAIVQSGLTCHIKCVLTSLNIDDVPEMLRQLKIIGIGKVSFNVFGDDTRTTVHRLRPSKQSLADLCACINGIKDASFYVEMPSLQAEPHICGSLVHTMYLNENGVVGYCFKNFGLKQLQLGNIADMSLDEIWNSSRAMQLLIPGDEVLADGCNTCSRRQKCFFYGCLYDRLAYSGEVFGRASDCSV